MPQRHKQNRQDVDDEGAPRLGLLATMASALKETDPEEGAAIDGLARRLAGREYFLDPRVFNYPQVRTTMLFSFVPLLLLLPMLMLSLFVLLCVV